MQVWPVYTTCTGTLGKQTSFDNLDKDESAATVSYLFSTMPRVSPPDRRDVRVCIRQRQNPQQSTPKDHQQAAHYRSSNSSSLKMQQWRQGQK